MNLNNPIHQAIYDKVVLPAMNQQQGIVDGYVIQVDYETQTCEVSYTDTSSHAMRTMKNVQLPKDGDGVFTQAVKNGDRVTVAFKNKSRSSPYITTVYKGNHSSESYKSPYGSRIIRSSRIF